MVSYSGDRPTESFRGLDMPSSLRSGHNNDVSYEQVHDYSSDRDNNGSSTVEASFSGRHNRGEILPHTAQLELNLGALSDSTMEVHSVKDGIHAQAEQSREGLIAQHAQLVRVLKRENGNLQARESLATEIDSQIEEIGAELEKAYVTLAESIVNVSTMREHRESAQATYDAEYGSLRIARNKHTELRHGRRKLEEDLQNELNVIKDRIDVWARHRESLVRRNRDFPNGFAGKNSDDHARERENLIKMFETIFKEGEHPQGGEIYGMFEHAKANDFARSMRQQIVTYLMPDSPYWQRYAQHENKRRHEYGVRITRINQEMASVSTEEAECSQRLTSASLVLDAAKINDESAMQEKRDAEEDVLSRKTDYELLRNQLDELAVTPSPDFIEHVLIDRMNAMSVDELRIWLVKNIDALKRAGGGAVGAQLTLESGEDVARRRPRRIRGAIGRLITRKQVTIDK